MYNGIKLFFKGVSQVVGSSEVSLLVLVNEEENRQLAILSDKLICEFKISILTGILECLRCSPSCCLNLRLNLS